MWTETSWCFRGKPWMDHLTEDSGAGVISSRFRLSSFSVFLLSPFFSSFSSTARGCLALFFLNSWQITQIWKSWAERGDRSGIGFRNLVHCVAPTPEAQWNLLAGLRRKGNPSISACKALQHRQHDRQSTEGGWWIVRLPDICYTLSPIGYRLSAIFSQAQRRL